MAHKYFIAFNLTFEDGTQEIDNSFFIPEYLIADIDDIRNLEIGIKQQHNQLRQSDLPKIVKATIISLSLIA